MFQKAGEIQIYTDTTSYYKREANILSKYSSEFTELIHLIYPIVHNAISNAYVSQFTQNTLRKGDGHVVFHRDPPYHLIESNELLGLQFCVLLTDFTIENGCTIFRRIDDFDVTSPIYLTGKKGDVYWWPCDVYHTEGINNTNHARSCLVLTIQSINAPNTNFTLGEDIPILPITEQYKHINTIQKLIVSDNKLRFV